MSLDEHHGFIVGEEAISKVSFMEKQYYVYFLTNKWNNVIYVGVTNDLVRRVYEHKEKLVEGFSKKYSVNKLVHFEIFDDIANAIAREKQIKGVLGRRKLI